MATESNNVYHVFPLWAINPVTDILQLSGAPNTRVKHHAVWHTAR
jgi:hypothetical protein